MPYHRMKLAVGVFVIALSALFFVLIYVILEKKGVFEETLSFNFNTESAEALYIGMPIRYSGFEIGNINNIELTERGTVHVLFDIKKEHAKWIRMNTLLRLEKPLIGSPTIDVLTSLEHPELIPGSTLKMVVQDDINDIITKIEPVINDLQNIVVSVNQMTEKLASEEGNLFMTLENLKSYSDQLVEDDALLTTLTGDANSTESLKATLAETEATVKEINTMVTELHDNVVTPSEATMQQLDTILADIINKLDTLEGTIDAIGSYDKDLIELKGDIRSGVQKTTNLIDQVSGMLGEDQPSEAPLP
ncbi:MAG: MlaD family protein [Sulfurimonadaceae bacterium]|nr:MlaD family protein [Sulfurimonadaceae bacterium]